MDVPKKPEDSGPIIDTAIGLCAVLLVATICALVLHWAGIV